MSNQTERMEDALRRVIGEKIAAEGEAERLRAEVARQERVNKGWGELWNHLRAALTSADHASDCPVTLIPGDVSLEQDGRLLECACLVGELWDALAGTEAGNE